MKQSKTFTSVCILLTAAFSLFAGESKTIKITEHPGYFETDGNVFQIEPGSYTFDVTNNAKKDAGFVISREGEPDQAIMIKNGSSGTLTRELKSGTYTYYCPIIPTGKYTIVVK